LSSFERLRAWAKRLKSELLALYLAYRHPRTPFYARVLAIVVVAYAFSPIDLIPDPIPVLGYLDDLILIPLGIALAVRMIPPGVLDECRTEVREGGVETGPRGTAAAVAVVAIWLLVAALLVYVASGALGYR
jgi:uncharacterized membrane protein YkvA (DUF1232 family)